MKNLIKYKVFESRFDDFKSILDNLRDYSLEFSDDGLPIQIEPSDDIGIRVRSMNIPTSDNRPFFLRVYSDFTIGSEFFKFQKYTPCILSIIDYMKSEGYITNIKIEDCYYKSLGTNYLIHKKSLEIDGDDLVNDELKNIPYNGTNDYGVIRLDRIESIRKITLEFDKIDKNYDI